MSIERNFKKKSSNKNKYSLFYKNFEKVGLCQFRSVFIRSRDLPSLQNSLIDRQIHAEFLLVQTFEYLK